MSETVIERLRRVHVEEIHSTTGGARGLPSLEYIEAIIQALPALLAVVEAAKGVIRIADCVDAKEDTEAFDHLGTALAGLEKEAR